MSDNDSDDITRKHVQLARDILVGHYRIIERIGAGGMGEVYLAEDTELNRKVALKFLPHDLCQDPDCRARFKREAQAAAKLNHPNIVTIYEVGEFSGRPFLVMELVEGESLRGLIRSERLSVRQIIDLTVQISGGLVKAHEAGIIHRDIKPSNILVDRDGRPKIADFGLASYAGSEPISATGARIGTIRYMSPEQIRGEKVDHRSDLFSLGVVLYELVTGRNPFDAAEPVTVLESILHGTTEPLARFKVDVPEGLQSIVSRALEKDAAVRYQSAADMMADLMRLRRRSSDTQSAPYADRPSSRTKWKRAGYPLLGVLILALAVSAWFVFLSGENTEGRIQNHLAIVPFVNLGGPTASQVFCDGLLETLTSKLTQLGEFDGELLVVPASEVREYGIRSAGQARKTFGVNLVVTGSIQPYGDGIRATLNLVDAVNERQLRSTIVDKSQQDVSSLQDSSVVELARMLSIQMRPDSRRVMARGGTASSGAYSAYLEGQGYLQDHDDARSLDSAVRLFERATQIDSSYALAYAGLGEAYWRKYDLTKDVSWTTPAIVYSSRALELDDQLAPVLVTMGLVHIGMGHSEEAISYFRRALQIDSMSIQAYNQLASAYETLNRTVEAQSLYEKAIALRPKFWRGYYNLATFLAFQGRNDEALKQLSLAESLAPVATFPYELFGNLYTFLGAYEKARACLERSLSVEPTYAAYSNLGAIYQLEEQMGKAAGMYERALELNDKDYRVWSNLGWIHKNIPGNQEKAQSAYARAIALAEQNLAVNPNDAVLICHLADCYWQTGARDKSLLLARRAVQLSPEDAEVLVRGGIIYEESGLREEALQLIGKALAKGSPLQQIKNTEELRRLVTDPRFDSVVRSTR